MRKHAYTGAPNTCLWCGRPIPERFTQIPGPLLSGSGVPVLPTIGGLWQGKRVRAVEAHVKTSSRRWRAAREDETTKGAVSAYRVFYDPPLRGGVLAFVDPHDASPPPAPVFDIPSCARLYGRWAAGRDLAKGTATPPPKPLPEPTFRVYRAPHIHKDDLHQTITAPSASAAALVFGKAEAAAQYGKDGHRVLFIPTIVVVDVENHVQVFSLHSDKELVYRVEPFKTKQEVY